MKKKIAAILSVLMLSMSLTACVPKKLNVMVTNYPVEFLVKRIAGDSVNVDNIAQGSTPQLATIRPSYDDLFEEADVLFYINELQPYFEMYSDELNDSKIELVDLAERSALYPFQRYTTIYSSDKEALIEEDYYDSQAFDITDTYDNDPMLWMDSIAMTSMARSIKDWLIEARSDDEKFFQKNFEDLEVELTQLQTNYQNIRDSETHLSFVSMTPSFGNWQRSFNLNVYPVSISKYGVLPSKEQLDVIRDRISKDGVLYIAKEENLPADYAKLYNQLKTELELEEIELSNIFTLSEKDKDDGYDYIDKMYQNLETLEAITKEQ